MNALRIALVGAGAIAPSHLKAIEASPVELVGIAATPGSERAKDLASKFSTRAFRDLDDLIREISSSEIDGVICAIDSSQSSEVAHRLASAGLHVLLEKPGAMTSVEMRKSLGGVKNLIRIGYNRRFYETTRALSDYLLEVNPNYFRLEVFEPDSSESGYLQRRLVSNGVHGLDLVRFLFGQVKVVSRGATGSNSSSELLTFSVISENGISGELVIGKGIPKNSSLEVYGRNGRLLLLPFEKLSYFEKMDISEPTQELPLRTYRPKLEREVACWANGENRQIKPGFERQLQGFGDFIRGVDSEESRILCSVDDAALTLELAEKLLEQ